MKSVLLAAAALGLSVTGAYAECAGHVSAGVDRDVTVASVTNDEKTASVSQMTKAEGSSATQTVTTQEEAD